MGEREGVVSLHKAGHHNSPRKFKASSLLLPSLLPSMPRFHSWAVLLQAPPQEPSTVGLGRDDGEVGVTGWFGGSPTLQNTQPSPLAIPSSYLLVHQFRLHIAWQLGDCRAEAARWVCRGLEAEENKKQALCGAVWAFGGIAESGWS